MNNQLLASQQASHPGQPLELDLPAVQSQDAGLPAIEGLEPLSGNDHTPIVSELPVETEETIVVSKENKRPGWRRKLGAVVLAGLVQVGVIGAVSYKGTDEALASPAPVEHVMKESFQNSGAEQSTKAPNVKQEYEQAKVIEQDTPFPATFMTETQRARWEQSVTRLAEINNRISSLNGTPNTALSTEHTQATQQQNALKSEFGQAINDETIGQKNVETALSQYDAKFVTAVQLSSGMKINLYSSGLDDPSEPLEFDAKALDVIVNELIKRSGDIKGSPINEQIKELQAKAQSGQLNIRLSLIMVSDEKLCLGDPLAGQQLNQLDSREVISCQLGGLNFRSNTPGVPTLNQFSIVLDGGRGKPRKFYGKKADVESKMLSADQTTTLILAHELAHAEYGATNLNKITPSELEHEMFVNVVEKRMWDFIVNQTDGHDNKKLAKYVTPFHVEDNAKRQNRN